MPAVEETEVRLLSCRECRLAFLLTASSTGTATCPRCRSGALTRVHTFSTVNGVGVNEHWHPNPQRISSGSTPEPDMNGMPPLTATLRCVNCHEPVSRVEQHVTGPGLMGRFDWACERKDPGEVVRLNHPDETVEHARERTARQIVDAVRAALQSHSVGLLGRGETLEAIRRQVGMESPLPPYTDAPS